MKKVLSITLERDDYKRIFAEHGIFVEFCKNDFDEIVEKGKDADAIIFEGTRFTNELFDKLPNLRILSRSGIGIDTVDMAAATAHGVVVCNCANYGTYDVAQHTVALLLALVHRIPQYDSAIKSENSWDFLSVPMASRLSEKTLGIVGFGRISKWICRMLSAFGMKISVYDPYMNPDDAKALGITPATLDEVLTGSDFISVNAPLNESTHHMINREAISKMRDGVLIINTSRGGLIDTEALIEALESGKIAGAALDVFESEPFDADCRLRSMKNVITTPHIAWHSAEAIRDLALEVTSNITDFFENKPLKNQLNMK